jgi:hypothetical protein
MGDAVRKLWRWIVPVIVAVAGGSCGAADPPKAACG